mgnify:CR=1 FL=1
MNEQEKINEVALSAEIFIHSASDECDGMVLDTYKFTFEELRCFLICFGSGLIDTIQNDEIKSLHNRLGEKILLRARDSITFQRERMHPYNADETAYLWYGIEFLTDHLLDSFSKKEQYD